MLILVVEDDQQMREHTIEVLENYKILTAHSGIEAIEKVKQNRPDLILLDINIPSPDGLEVCRTIKNTDDSIKIIFLSGLNDLENRLKAYNAGADDYVVKPFSANEFLAKIDVYRRLIELEKILKTKNSLFKVLVLKMTEVASQNESAIFKKIDFITRYHKDIAHQIKEHLASIRVYSNLLFNKYQDEPFLNNIIFSIDQTELLFRDSLLLKPKDQASQVNILDFLKEQERYWALNTDLCKTVKIKNHLKNSPEIWAIKPDLFQAFHTVFNILLKFNVKQNKLTEIFVVPIEESEKQLTLLVSQDNKVENFIEYSIKNFEFENEFEFAKTLFETNSGTLLLIHNALNNSIGFTIQLNKVYIA